MWLIFKFKLIVDFLNILNYFNLLYICYKLSNLVFFIYLNYTIFNFNIIISSHYFI